MTQQQLGALDWFGWTISNHTQYLSHVKHIVRMTQEHYYVRVYKCTEGLFWVNNEPFSHAEEAFDEAERVALRYGGWADGS